MKKIIVSLGRRSYPIIFKTNLFKDPSAFSSLKKNDQVMLITNETLAPLYLNKIYQLLKKIGIKVDSIILPDGEQYKNLTTINIIFTKLLKKLHNRDTTLIAIGGGVIGDLTGFVASNYKRGVRFIQIPTTLLSQVDSSIGGKTAINHSLGKNMIGSFYQPTLVLIDLKFLKTLPINELSSGLAEVIKYSIALDKKFFFWLEKNIDSLLALDNTAIKYCIYHCCKIKANIVSIDETEKNLRTLLNLGHTYGHAIETETGYGKWLHGEAISAGMVMAAYTSECLGKLKKEEVQRIIRLIKRAGLPTKGPYKMSVNKYLHHMMFDKKVSKNKINLIIPVEIGKSEILSGISENIIFKAIYQCNNR